MNKFLAVVKREYVQKVRTKFFVIMTILGPFMLALFTVVPGLLLNIKTGETRLVIIDQTDNGKLYQSLRAELQAVKRSEIPTAQNQIANSANSNAKSRFEEAGKSMRGAFAVEEVSLKGRPVADVQRELNARIAREELDGYLILPPDLLSNSKSKAVYYGRNISDVFTRNRIEHHLNDAVRRQRLLKQGVKDEEIDSLSERVDLIAKPINEKGEEGAEDSGNKFVTVFILAFLIYLSILLYGQVVLGAVVEEKETRIAEILFSSVRPFTLMIGKLIGVSLMAITQLSIWGLAFGGLAAFAVPALIAQGMDVHLPELPKGFFLFFVLFFILGYFLYATLYLLVGSMVTTAQEGGQLAMPIIFLLVAALYMAFVVIRSPNSPLSFWISLTPFFSPIIMMVRIASLTPPLWQIVLSLVIGYGTVVLLLFVAARVYRVGMLMYGKKATIPEAWRWLRQS